MKYSELTKKLKKNGCLFKEYGTNHDIWYSPVTEKTFVVPRHKTQEVKTGIANAIMKQAGLK